MSDHDPPESAITMGRNTHRRQNRTIPSKGGAIRGAMKVTSSIRAKGGAAARSTDGGPGPDDPRPVTRVTRHPRHAPPIGVANHRPRARNSPSRNGWRARQAAQGGLFSAQAPHAGARPVAHSSPHPGRPRLPTGLGRMGTTTRDPAPGERSAVRGTCQSPGIPCVLRDGVGPASEVAIARIGSVRSNMADNRQSKLRAPSERKGPASRHAAPSSHDPRGGRGPGRRFRKGHNAHGDEVFRRGPDLIPRGSVDLLFRTLLDDDGGLKRELKRHRTFRHKLALGFFRAAEHPRTAILVADRIADRLEGRPTVRTEKQAVRHHTITTRPATRRSGSRASGSSSRGAYCRGRRQAQRQKRCRSRARVSKRCRTFRGASPRVGAAGRQERGGEGSAETLRRLTVDTKQRR
jgi:hypothetical protein